MKKLIKNFLILGLTAFPISFVMSTKINDKLIQRDIFEDITKNKNTEEKNYASNFPENEIIYQASHNGAYFRDKQYRGGILSLKIDNKIETFSKGIGVHAGCTITFDLRKHNYDKFSTYYGMDPSQNGSTGAKISFYTSDSDDVNHATWDILEEDPQEYFYTTNARKVSLNVQNKKFLRITINSLPGRSNSYNHINFAQAMFHKNSVSFSSVDGLKTKYPFIKDANFYATSLINVQNVADYSATHANNLYKKMFIENIGLKNLLDLIDSNSAYLEAAQWLFNDNEAMELLMTGGNLDNNDNNIGWRRVFENLANLFFRYKTDLNNNTLDLDTNVRLGLIYKKMLISLALTHINDTPNYGFRDFWGSPNSFSDKYYRYETFKTLRLENDEQDQKEYLAELKDIPEAQRKYWQKAHIRKLEEQIAANAWHWKINKAVFDNLPVEYMRWVFNGFYSDSEIKWFNYFARRKYGFNGQISIGGYDFMPYTQADAHTKFYKEFNLFTPTDPKAIAKFAEMDAKYKLTKFGIPNDGRYRFWAAVEVGQVCGGISKHGVSMLASTGHPATVIGQPGHGAYLNYSFNNWNNDANGKKAIWRIDNNVGGWMVAEKGERMPLNWVRKNINGNNVNYVTLSARALENIDSYIKSQFWVELINRGIVEDSNLNKKEIVLENALQLNKYNYNAWTKLVDVYKASTTKSVENKKQLAKRILEDLRNFPFVYNDLIKKLLNNETDSSLKFDVNVELKKTLELDRSAQNHDTFYHAHITREQASGLLNEDRSQLATFSFSGPNANKIMINEMYKNSSNTYRYSLDGGNSFTQTQDSEILLNEKEIKKVCTVCGIIVGIMGSSQNFKVVINKQILAQDDYFANNDEGKLSGNKEHLVWSYDKQNWTRFSDDDLRVTKETNIFIKKESYDNNAESNILEYTLNKITDANYSEDIYLTSDNYTGKASNDETKAKNLSMTHLFDGDYTTSWHTNYNDANTDKYIIWNFKKAIDISKLEYIPYKIEHVILEGKIYASNEEAKEATEWKEVSSFNWDNNLGYKYFYFDKNETRHLKLTITRTSNGNSRHASARGFNIWTRNLNNNRVLSEKIKISTNSEEIVKENNSINNALNDLNTIWHTKWDKSITDPYVLFELDSIKKITKIKYIPRQDVTSGYITKVKVFVSNDGINFKEIEKEITWENNKSAKEIVFDTPIEAKFIKLANLKTSDGHAAAKKFEIFEKLETPNSSNLNAQDNKKLIMLTIGGVIALVVFTLVIALWVIFANKKKTLKAKK